MKIRNKKRKIIFKNKHDERKETPEKGCWDEKFRYLWRILYFAVSSFPVQIHVQARMSNLASKLGRIGPKWDKMGEY